MGKHVGARGGALEGVGASGPQCFWQAVTRVMRRRAVWVFVCVERTLGTVGWDHPFLCSFDCGQSMHPAEMLLATRRASFPMHVTLQLPCAAGAPRMALDCILSFLECVGSGGCCRRCRIGSLHHFISSHTNQSKCVAMCSHQSCNHYGVVPSSAPHPFKPLGVCSTTSASHAREWM